MPDPAHHPLAPTSCAGGCPLADAPVAVDDGMDRRTFIARSVLAAAAAALAACGGAGDATAPSSVSGTVDVASQPALATTGGVALVTVSGAQLAVVRTGETSFVALSRVCPHEGGRIDQGSGGFVCSRHGARFTTTGTWTGGQRTSNMRAYPTSYDAQTGVLTIG